MKEIGDGRLDGRVAIVTGAGQGGGMGSALAIAAKGANLVLFGRTLSKLEKIAAEVEALGSKAICVSGDVTSADDRRRLIDEAVKAFGRLDILVCAAQSPDQRDMAMLDTSLELVDELWQSGFVATFDLMRLAHPHMKAAGGGSIINFCSAAVVGPQMFTAYGGVKAAIQSMSRGAAMEWGRDNIRVNCVYPFVKSPSEALYNENNPEHAKVIHARRPIPRTGEPEDIGRPVAFLACDESRYITGMVMPLDGGSTYLR